MVFKNVRVIGIWVIHRTSTFKWHFRYLLRPFLSNFLGIDFGNVGGGALFCFWGLGVGCLCRFLGIDFGNVGGGGLRLALIRFWWLGVGCRCHFLVFGGDNVGGGGLRLALIRFWGLGVGVGSCVGGCLLWGVQFVHLSNVAHHALAASFTDDGASQYH